MSKNLVVGLLGFLIPVLLFARTPNIVYIISDDQTYTDFGFMGHPRVQTPHIDKLAEQSAVFPNGYVAQIQKPLRSALVLDSGMPLYSNADDGGFCQFGDGSPV